MMPTWICVLILGAASGIVLGFVIRIKLRIYFTLSSSPKIGIHWRFWFWQGQISNASGPVFASTELATKVEAETVAAPKVKGASKNPSPRGKAKSKINPNSRKAWLREKMQRGLFHLGTDSRFWMAFLRSSWRLPKRLWRGLHGEVAFLQVSANDPETLGRLAGWSAAIPSALGCRLPLGWDFSVREWGVHGELKAHLHFWGLMKLLLTTLAGFPWKTACVSFWRGAAATRLPGWRETGFNILRKLAVLA